MNAKNTTAATTSFDYDAYEILADNKKRLELSASHIHQLGRKSTEQTFELGKHLADASELLPEGSFGKWVSKRCGMTDRHARNFRAVHHALADYRNEFVDLGVNSTVLFRLTSATEDQIESAIDLCKQTGSIRVKDIQAILADGVKAESPPVIELADVGGIDGLKAIIAAKARDGLKSFVTHLETMQARIDVALSGKRLVKSKLADDIEALARVAKVELTSLALFVQQHPDYSSQTWNIPFPANSRWRTVFDLLYKLGGRDGWPEKAKMNEWLESQVLPALAWATAKTKNPEWDHKEVRSDAPVPQEISDNLRNGFAALGGDVVIEKSASAVISGAGRTESAKENIDRGANGEVFRSTNPPTERKTPPFVAKTKAGLLTAVPVGDANLH